MEDLRGNAHIRAQMALTAPDRVLFAPRKHEGEGDNVHLYVVEHEKYGGLLAFWTQSTVEGTGNNHLVTAGSRDGGRTWTEPRFIIGSHGKTKEDSTEPQASWGFPVVTRSGRIYLFYYREIPGVVDVSRQLTGAFSATYSDDCGETWSESGDIRQRLTPYDSDPYIQDDIVFEVPMRGPDGKYLAGFTKYVSTKAPPEYRGGCAVFFYRFDNIDDDPEVKDIKITTLPEDEKGIRVFHPDGTIGRIEEPAWVTLPDGRLFCTMRTDLGTVFWSVSSDGGVSWEKPRSLYFDDDTPFVHPLSPCPVYDLGGGRYMQLYHGACGTGDGGSIYYPRHTLYRAFGYFDPKRRQPVRFPRSESELYMTLGPGSDSLGYGPELAIYGTMTHSGGENVLWYPDRKFFLLGKVVR